MSSVIRSGDNRSYWIISNGKNYIDGVTDPNLVTTVGNGYYICYVGNDYNEYVSSCYNYGIIPRNSDPNIPSTGNVLPGQDQSNTLDYVYNQIKTIEDKVIPIQNFQNTVQDFVNDVPTIKQTLESINTVVVGSRISATQARLWLINNNINLDSIYNAINSIPDEKTKQIVLSKWEYAPYIEKSDPWINNLASMLGLTQTDIDRAFNEACYL